MNASVINSTITNLSIKLHSCNGLKTVWFKRTTDVIATAISTAFLNAGFGMFAVAANLLVMIVIYRKGSNRIPADLYIASLSLADFLVGLLVQPLFVILRLHELMDIHLCSLRMAYAFIGYICCGSSMLVVCLFGLDRAFALACPYIYVAEATEKKSAIVIASVLNFYLIYTALPFIGVISSKSYYLCLVCIVLLSLTVSIICYIYSVIVVRKHTRKIASSAPNHKYPSTAGDGNTRIRNLFRLAAKRNKSLLILIIASAFVLCFIPKVCILIAISNQRSSYDVFYVEGKWSDTLIFMNSSMNPIIYAIRIKEMRQEMMMIIQFLKGKIFPK